MCFAVLALAGLAQADIRIQPEVNRTQIYAGEAFVLYVRVVGADAGIETPVIETGGAAEVALLGSQSESFAYFGVGTRNEGRVFLMSVRPKFAGVCKLGPVRVTVRGKTYEAAIPAVEVTGVEEQDFVKVTIKSDAREVLVDQPFTVTLEVRVRGLEGQFAATEPLLTQSPSMLEADYLNFDLPKGLEGPDANTALGGIVVGGNAPGFAINNYRRQGFGGFPGFPGMAGFDDMMGSVALRFRPEHRTEQVNGALWHVYTLATTYTGREEGEYEFGPVTFKGAVIAGVNVVRGRGQPVPREIFAVGPARVVRVAPPPEEGRPKTFFGGVGKAMRVRTELDAAVCKVGDPLTLTLDVTGEVSLRNLRPPLISDQAGIADVFRVYDDSVTSATIDAGRRFTYRVRPLVSGTIEFPPLELSFYNAATRRYETARTQPIPLQVQATTQIVAEDGPDEAGGLRADTQDNRPSGITLSRHARTNATARPAFWLLLAIGPLLFAACVATDRILPRMRTAANAARAWQRSRSCHGALRTASDAPQLDHAFRRYLTTRMKLAGQSITPPEAEAALRDMDDTAARETRACLEQLAEAVYRPGGGEDFAALKAATLACVTKLDAARAKPKRVHTLGLLLLATLAAGTLRADDFGWDRANTRMATAATRADYLEAARLYNELPPDGGVMMNMGAALLMANEPAAACEALERAERRLGHTVPGLARDVNTALRMKRGAPGFERPWPRVLFFWHYAMPMDVRLMLGAAGWAALWLALMVWRLAGSRWQGWRRATLEAMVGIGCVAGVALMLVFGASGVVSAVQDIANRHHSPLEFVTPDAEDAP